MKSTGNELAFGAFSRVCGVFSVFFRVLAGLSWLLNCSLVFYDVLCCFFHFLEVSPGFWVVLFILRRAFVVFDRLKSAALSPNLFREAI